MSCHESTYFLEQYYHFIDVVLGPSYDSWFVVSCLQLVAVAVAVVVVVVVVVRSSIYKYYKSFILECILE
jgi:hypothetical protein